MPDSPHRMYFPNVSQVDHQQTMDGQFRTEVTWHPQGEELTPGQAVFVDSQGNLTGRPHGESPAGIVGIVLEVRTEHRLTPSYTMLTDGSPPSMAEMTHGRAVQTARVLLHQEVLHARAASWGRSPLEPVMSELAAARAGLTQPQAAALAAAVFDAYQEHAREVSLASDDPLEGVDPPRPAQPAAAADPSLSSLDPGCWDA